MDLDKNNIEVDNNVLRKFVAERSSLPQNIVEFIQNERSRMGSPIQIWFEQFDRKLGASGSDIGWDAVLLSEKSEQAE